MFEYGRSQSNSIIRSLGSRKIWTPKLIKCMFFDFVDWLNFLVKNPKLRFAEKFVGYQNHSEQSVPKPRISTQAAARRGEQNELLKRAPKPSTCALEFGNRGWREEDVMYRLRYYHSPDLDVNQSFNHAQA